MFLNKKLRLMILITLICFLGSINEINAQKSCDEGFRYARQSYYKGQYERVHKFLQICIDDFSTNKYYYQNQNPARVFKVYKLIIEAYYNNDLDYLAERKELELIVYFSNLERDKVITRLKNTNF